LIVLLLALPSVASAKTRKAPYRPNMPVGWTWPPNKTMVDDGAQCLANLDAIGVKWQKAKGQGKIATPITIPAMELGGLKLHSIWRKGDFVMDCHLALALATSGGPALRSIGVTQINFFGIYEYRNVHGTHILSRHAVGLAMDVGSFVTDDGAVHVVKSDYKHGDSVLLAAEQLIDTTGAFRILLTPGNDPKHHYDHFHFEARTPEDVQVHMPAKTTKKPKTVSRR
jgi:hypothetical protein